MTEFVQYDHESDYDLYGETDYSAEGHPDPAQHCQPLYRIRRRNFINSCDMHPDGIGKVISGIVIPRGMNRADGHPVMAGNTQFGVIRDGYFVRGDGERFRLVDVTSHRPAQACIED